MTQAETDRIRGIVRIKPPGCGEVVIDLNRIVDRALKASGVGGGARGG